MCKVCLAIMGLATLAAAAPIDAVKSAEFSADVFEVRPSVGVRSGRLYVRGASRRFEYQVRGLPVIEIDLPEQGIRRIVFPLNRSYVEQPLPADTTAQPCMRGAGVSCAKAVDAEIDGIKTEIWASSSQAMPRETRVWWDATRRLALRTEHGDGGIMQATRAPDAVYEGRTVERWRITYRFPGGRMLPAEAWYDSSLGMTIAEWSGDGARRQLVNLTPGPVETSKFEAPAGFNRLPSPPTPVSDAAGAAARGDAGRRLAPMQTPGAAVAAPPSPAQPAATIKPASPPPAVPPAKPSAPEPARQVDAPTSVKPAVAAGPVVSPQATPSVAPRAGATSPPLPQPKPAQAAAAAKAAAAAAALGASKAPKPQPTKKPATAKGKPAPTNGSIPNPSGIPTLGALPASVAGATAAARKAGGSGKKGTTRSKKGRRKAR